MKTKKVLHGFLTAAAAVSLILILLLSAFEIAAYSDFGFYQKEYEKYEKAAQAAGYPSMRQFYMDAIDEKVEKILK